MNNKRMNDLPKNEFWFEVYSSIIFILRYNIHIYNFIYKFEGQEGFTRR